MILPRANVLNSLKSAKFDWHPETVRRFCGDENYYIPTEKDVVNEVVRYLAYMRESELSYQLGRYDCNAFALLVHGWATLQAWKDDAARPPWPLGHMFAGFNMAEYKMTGHALNVCLVRTAENKLVWMWIEPQTGQVGPAETCGWGHIWSVEI